MYLYILLFKSVFHAFYDFETENGNLLPQNTEFDILENGELVTLLWPLKADMKWPSESSSDLNTWPDD